ncbi:PH domain-containing protein [Planomicrobium sp. CPCC 101079]|uniref:PH domain-containing protein n=1 Tax=Planomicrobium sp. CPCC 101079 TaxID=2599618 RepID=UPI001645F45E|nr:PH domain-containing protein [Planomicrobium sp. CPCC 101079]
MGFFKKKEVSAEEQAKLDADKAERERLRQEKAAAREKQRAIDSAARTEKKEAKKLAEQTDLERFFGSDSGYNEQMNRIAYSVAINRIRDQLLGKDENVFATVPVEYDMAGGKEVKGVLIATDQKLVYSSNSINKEFTEIMDYKSMSSISLAADGFLKKELHVTSGREKRVFDDIKDDKHLTKLLDSVRKQIASAHSGSSTQPHAAAPQLDKYQQLEQISKLKEQGILTEAEFQVEKTKILNT